MRPRRSRDPPSCSSRAPAPPNSNSGLCYPVVLTLFRRPYRYHNDQPPGWVPWQNDDGAVRRGDVAREPRARILGTRRVGASPRDSPQTRGVALRYGAGEEDERVQNLAAAGPRASRRASRVERRRGSDRNVAPVFHRRFKRRDRRRGGVGRPHPHVPPARGGARLRRHRGRRRSRGLRSRARRLPPRRQDPAPHPIARSHRVAAV